MAAGSGSTSEGADRTAAASCPKCGTRLVLHRMLNPHIDSCGFENYFLRCNQCGVWLIGIIDPYDEALLLTEIEG
jgi:uncharacterized Zn finger protein